MYPERSSEGLRKPIDEDAHGLVDDLREYEIKRVEKHRDTHIAYARSIEKRLAEGYTHEWIAEQLQYEVPFHGHDPVLIFEFANFVLAENNREIRLDERLGITTVDGEVIHPGFTEEFLQEYYNSLAQRNIDNCAYIAEAYGSRMVSGFNIDAMVTLLKNDLVWYEIDSVLVSEYLNKYLKSNNSIICFDQYLNQVTV